MLFVNEKYKPLSAFFEDEMNEGKSVYSSNQEINDFIMERNLPRIKKHLESAYDNSGFTNAENPWLLIFKEDGNKKGTLYYTTNKKVDSSIKDSSKESVEFLFGNNKRYNINEIINGNMHYFTVEDTKDREIITFKFKGTGNTSTEGVFPSSTDMEMVLAYAFNHDIFGSDVDGNLSAVGITKSKDKYEPYYEANKEWLAPLANHIRRKLKVLEDISSDATLRKLPNKEVSKSDSWGGSDNTPKTDIITSDGKAKLSVKNASGAQAMSGALDESQSTIMAVLRRELQNLNKNKDLANKIKTALQLTVEDGEVLDNAVDRVLFSVKDIDDISPDSLGWTRTVKKELLSNNNQQKIRKDIHAKLAKIFDTLLNADDNFKKAVVRESLLGEIKFGGDSIAVPNCMLTWEIGKKTCIIQTVDEYIDKVYNKVKSTINFKGSEETTYTALRLSLPKKIIDDAVNEATLNAEEALKDQLSENDKPRKSTKSKKKSNSK